MVEANSSAAATNAGRWSSRKRRDSGSKNESVEHARTLRPSKRLKTLDISLPKPLTKKRRWNDRVETNREMGIAEEQDPETEEAVREHQESSRRRTHLRRGGDSADGLVRNRVMTVSLQQRGESGLEDHLPGCKEEEDQTAATAEEKQKWKKGEEIWMQYSSPQIIDEDWKSQRLRYESSVTPHTKKRKAINSEELHQQQPQEKKTCIQADAQRGDQVLDSGDARMRKEAGGNRKWKRIPRSKSSDVNTSEDMGVMISEAWKRLREEEEDNNDGENSVHTHSEIGSSLSTKTTEQETMTHGMSFKKVQLEKSSQGRKWRRLNPASAAAADKEGSVQQQHEGRDSDLLLGSSGGASCTYLHNRMRKRPRFENLISVQGKALRKQQQQQQEMVQRSKKRSVSETPGVSRKKQRIHF
jgi:hypothetical protein